MPQGLVLTGCAGFIGLNFLLQLDKEGELLSRYHKIISIDKLGYATAYNKDVYIELCDGLGIERVDCNINELTKHYKFSKDFRWDVLDFASESHVDNSIAHPFVLYEENSNLSANLLSAFEEISSIRSFFHISTDEVYGDLPLNAKERDWFATDSPMHPNNPYAASKAAQDCFLMSMKHTFGLPLRIIRMANQFGIFQHPEKMLPASCLRAFRNEPIKVYGNGSNIRQWTPVEVTVKIIHDKLLKMADFEVLHIANKRGLVDNNYIVGALVDTIELCTRTKPTIMNVPDRLGHDKMYALKTTREIDEYFIGCEIDQGITNVAEFYHLKKDDYK